MPGVVLAVGVQVMNQLIESLVSWGQQGGDRDNTQINAAPNGYIWQITKGK